MLLVTLTDFFSEAYKLILIGFADGLVEFLGRLPLFMRIYTITILGVSVPPFGLLTAALITIMTLAFWFKSFVLDVLSTVARHSYRLRVLFFVYEPAVAPQQPLAAQAPQIPAQIVTNNEQINLELQVSPDS